MLLPSVTLTEKLYQPTPSESTGLSRWAAQPSATCLPGTAFLDRRSPERRRGAPSESGARGADDRTRLTIGIRDRR